MTYKGYTGRWDCDREDNLFYGRVAGISDVITYQGKTHEEVSKAFVESVEDYLAFCKEREVEPNRPKVTKNPEPEPEEYHQDED
jgi:predicted HicB family RNase H-like nuclease